MKIDLKNTLSVLMSKISSSVCPFHIKEQHVVYIRPVPFRFSNFKLHFTVFYYAI
jgi:hypothetical protein